MSPRSKTKAQSERSHFKRRLSQRYGIHINRTGYWHLVDLVKSGQSEFLYSQSNTRSVHRIAFKHRGRSVGIIAIYDKSRGELVTALPQHLTEEDIRIYNGDD